MCKVKVLSIPLELPSSASAAPEHLLPRCVRLLQAARMSMDTNAGWLQAMLLKLLVTWVVGCPPAANALLGAPQHLPLLADLCSSQTASASLAGCHVAGIAAVLLGVLMVEAEEVGGVGPLTVLDVILARGGLSEYFTRWDEMRMSELFQKAVSAPRLPVAITRASAAAAAGAGESGADGTPPESPAAGGVALYDPSLVSFVTGVGGEALQTACFGHFLL